MDLTGTNHFKVLMFCPADTILDSCAFFLNGAFLCGSRERMVISKNMQFIFGAFTGSAPVQKLGLDNLVLSDKSEAMNLMPPDLACAVVNRDRISMTVDSLPGDSLGVLVLARDSGFTSPVFRRRFPFRKCRPFVTPFPLLPGSYWAKAAVLRKNGLRTEYSPMQKVVISGGPDTGAPYPAVLGATFYEEQSGRRVPWLVPERWYVLEAALSHVHDAYAIFWLHHRRSTDGNLLNKGGAFDRRDHYVFNFSLTRTPMLFIQREDQKGRSLRMNGVSGPYADDRDRFFRVDTNKKAARVRFRLLREAEPGDWLLSGYLHYRDSAYSYQWAMPIRVLSAWEAGRIEARERGARNRRIVSGVLSGVLALALVGLWIRKKRRGLVPGPSKSGEKSLLTRLRDDGRVMPDPSFKHSHLLIKSQKFILENLGHDISQVDVARHLDVSQAWIGRIFKKGTGLTVVTFINRLRIDRAMELLSQSDMSVTDISMAVGFAGQENFRRVFREFEGCTPSEYRERRHSS